MRSNNHPIDTRCKRAITRGGRRLTLWMAKDCPADDRERLNLLIERLEEAGAKDFWVGDTIDDDGTERLDSFIVALFANHKKDAKVVAVVTAIETELKMEEPGSEIGAVFAHVRIRR